MKTEHLLFWVLRRVHGNGFVLPLRRRTSTSIKAQNSWPVLYSTPLSESVRAGRGYYSQTGHCSFSPGPFLRDPHPDGVAPIHHVLGWLPGRGQQNEHEPPRPVVLKIVPTVLLSVVRAHQPQVAFRI